MTPALPVRRSDLIVEVHPQKAQLSDPETGEVHVLNSTAFAIWELCDGATDVETMAAVVEEVTSLDGIEARAQVTAAIALLREKGLLQ